MYVFYFQRPLVRGWDLTESQILRGGQVEMTSLCSWRRGALNEMESELGPHATLPYCSPHYHTPHCTGESVRFIVT
jgi:hypothetical protein